MPKLNEMIKNRKLKILLVGGPGAGKTVAGTSLARKGPMRVFDFDGKLSSAANHYIDEPETLANITYDSLQANLAKDTYGEFINIIDKDLIPQQRNEKMDIDTLMLDSITTFSSSTLKYIVKTNPGIKRPTFKQGVQPCMQDYGILKREFLKLIPGLIDLPCNIIMTAHINITKDELSGEILRTPVMDGSFSQELGVYFDEVWVLSVDAKGNRIAQTQSNYKFKFCRSQIKGLPTDLDITAGIDKALEPYL